MSATMKAADDAITLTGDAKDSTNDDDNATDEEVLIKSMDGYPSTPHFPFSPSVIHSTVSYHIMVEFHF
jgi:hypothetical protein